MRLKTNIVLWVSLATVVPLTLLGLGATTYSERLYQEDVSREAVTNLNNMVAEIDRLLYYDRQMILSLANAPAMRQFLPVLARSAEYDLHPEFFERAQVVEEFLAGFQGVVPGFKSLRVLDHEGNTFIKVHLGYSTVGQFDGIESFPFAEEEVEDDALVRRLRELPADDLSFLAMPQSQREWEGLRGPGVLDAIYPLRKDGRTVGFLVVSLGGDQIDSALDAMPRIYKGHLLVAELNPDDRNRNGIVLYDDIQGIRFGATDTASMHLQILEGGLLWNETQQRSDGTFLSDAGYSRTYYTEYLPYPNRLVSWVVAARIDLKELSAPFNRIRVGILVFLGIALLLTAGLAQLGARKITAPITALAQSLKRYANGAHDVRVQASGADEIEQLGASFNYMADTLEHAQAERDRAQRMMLQSAKLASIGQMAAGIGHEINNPLNNILSLTKLIERALDPADTRTRDDLKSLREEAVRASTIIKGVLNFARQVEPHYTSFAVSEWIEETVALTSQAAKERRVQIRAEPIAEAWIDGDRGQLQQVLVNLLINAIQASAPGQEIQVSTEAGAAGLTLQVRDQGSGIENNAMDKIFDPFFSTKAVGEGTGLGLSVSLGIIERHGGSLRLANNPRGGATATVELPLTATQLDTDAAKHSIMGRER